MRKHLTTTGLRVILTVTMFLIVGVGIGLFYLADKRLNTIAISVSHTTADAKAGEDSLTLLQNLQRELASYEPAITRASSIIANGASYQYQDQIIDQLNTYATQSGVAITGTTFPATGGTTTTPAPATSTTPATTTPQVTIPGVQSTSVNVTLATPVDYKSLLLFIRSIEQNLTKMQIAGITLTAADGDNVNTQALTIQVYIN